ncbi:MAG: class I SAM-dependent methyltransferase [Proteobacteria bacterium]|nr:class I SAM-dependent methyltransferase [Pseudomonadota bacterium]
MDPAASNPEDAPGGRVFFGDRAVARDEKPSLVRGVFEDVAGGYDVMNDLMSAGVHRAWKRALVDALNPAAPIRMADVAGGTGDIAFRVWERLRRSRSRDGAVDSRITVCDLTPAMVERGRDRALDRGIVDGIDFVVGDAQALPFGDRGMNAVTNAFGLRNVTDAPAALREARRVLCRGGRFLCLEFGGPVMPGLAGLVDAYTDRVLPVLGAAVLGKGDAYRYLAESIRRFPARDVVANWMEDAGLNRVLTQPLSGGIATLYSAWRL